MAPVKKQSRIEGATSFIVRRATEDDAGAIGRINTDSWRTTYRGVIDQTFLDAIDVRARIDSARARIFDPRLECLVLVQRSDETVVGFVDVGRCRDQKVDADGEVYAIYLRQEYQGRGGGRLLFASGLHAAKNRGHSKVMVSVLEQNQPSRRFYERMGGIYVGADRLNIDSRTYATSIYVWALE